MQILILYILATIGLTNIIINSTIMEPIRCFLKNHLPDSVYEVFECYQCMGTWCGALCGALVLCEHWVAYLFLYGFAGSFISSIMSIVNSILIGFNERMTTLPWEEENHND
jgi:hypothetical protein